MHSHLHRTPPVSNDLQMDFLRCGMKDFDWFNLARPIESTESLTSIHLDLSPATKHHNCNCNTCQYKFYHVVIQLYRLYTPSVTPSLLSTTFQSLFLLPSIKHSASSKTLTLLRIHQFVCHCQTITASMCLASFGWADSRDGHAQGVGRFGSSTGISTGN
mmetsp:Transcript_10481/g.25323  ORF Transcript_10481/g.25323 Transcript_10481/m.25323 type:complete len:160 (-) Transcript_10481:1105-1584(-)